MLLGIETSTDICSVVFQNKQGELFEERYQGRTVHSEKLFLSIDALMKAHSFGLSDLDGVVVSNGPGSYTGLRIAASGIKGLLFEEPCKLYTTNTLAGFAVLALDKNPDAVSIHSIMDARRTHVYHQQFDVLDGKLTPHEDLSVKDLQEVNNLLRGDDVVTGTGIERLDQKVIEQNTILKDVSISAYGPILLYNHYKETNLIQEVSVQQFEPNYHTSNQINNSMTKSS